MTQTQHIWYESLEKINLSLQSFDTLVICQRITRPWWVDNWARGKVRWYWSVDTLFWQLSTDHNIDVQLVFSWAPKLARKCESKHWFPCGADGSSGRRVVGQSVSQCKVTWLPNFLGWVDYHISLGMELRPRAWSSAKKHFKNRAIEFARCHLGTYCADPSDGFRFCLWFTLYCTVGILRNLCSGFWFRSTKRI